MTSGDYPNGGAKVIDKKQITKPKRYFFFSGPYIIYN